MAENKIMYRHLSDDMKKLLDSCFKAGAGEGTGHGRIEWSDLSEDLQNILISSGGGSTSSDSSSLKNLINKNSELIKGLQNQVNNIKSDKDYIYIQRPLCIDYTMLDDELAAKAKAVDGMQQTITDIVSGKIKALKIDRDHLSDEIKNYLEDIDDCSESIIIHNTKISAVENKIETLTSKVNSLDSTALSNKLDEIQEEFIGVKNNASDAKVAADSASIKADNAKEAANTIETSLTKRIVSLEQKSLNKIGLPDLDSTVTEKIALIDGLKGEIMSDVVERTSVPSVPGKNLTADGTGRFTTVAGIRWGTICRSMDELDAAKRANKKEILYINPSGKPEDNKILHSLSYAFDDEFDSQVPSIETSPIKYVPMNSSADEDILVCTTAEQVKAVEDTSINATDEENIRFLLLENINMKPAFAYKYFADEDTKELLFFDAGRNYIQIAPPIVTHKENAMTINSNASKVFFLHTPWVPFQVLVLDIVKAEYVPLTAETGTFSLAPDGKTITITNNDASAPHTYAVIC